MFKFLAKWFKRKPSQPRLVLPGHTGAVAAPLAPPKPGGRGQPVEAAPLQPAGTGPRPGTTTKEEWAKRAAQRLDRNATPEQLCAITPEMTKAQIADQLAMLYRRHNRAASSLDGTLREEAEIMLDVIAGLREKYLS